MGALATRTQAGKQDEASNHLNGGRSSSPADSSEVIRSLNPATGEVLGEVPVQGEAEVRAAVLRARQAQRAWGELSVAERATQMMRFRDAVLDHADEIALTISRETGKPKSEAMSMEVVVVGDLLNWFCRHAPEILAPERISLHLLKNRASYLHFVPRGVVGVIAPWNFPFGIAVGEVVMALLAGNGVVLKPSEMTPLVALQAKALYDQSGLPRELFQVVTGRGATGAALIDAGIDHCVFTGSTSTGRKVAAACGERLIPITLELGGKAPAIVCADADIDRTARALVWGAFANSGQVCASVERVYAHEAIHDELLARIVEHTRALRQGDPSGPAPVDLGAMTWDQQVSIVEQRVKQAVDGGARVLVGGERREGEGLFYAPTVLSECRQDMDVMRKEIFGPVMPVMKVTDEQEAVRLANDSHLGLLAYVFTRDTRRGRRLAERIAAGTVMVNDCLLTFGAPETPWGGVKQSGTGHTHSAKGLRDLCEQRHVNYDRLTLRRELWWFPYSDGFAKQMVRALRWLGR